MENPTSDSENFISEPQPVPAKEWVTVVTAYTAVFGQPELLPTGSSVEDATDAKWGSGDSELHLVKDSSGSALIRKGTEKLYTVRDANAVHTFMKIAEAGRLPIREKRSFTEVSLLRPKPRVVTVGSVYLLVDPKNVAGSASLGVIHNPDWT